MILKNRPITRHNPALQKIPELAKGLMSVLADDDVVANFDSHQLTGANQVTGDLNVRL